MRAGEFLAKTIQWAWDCGLLIQTDHRRMYTPGFPDAPGAKNQPYGYNMDLQLRKREECWPVLRFTHPGTNRSIETFARDWDEMEQMLEYRHKQIFADLGVPPWPTAKKGKTI